MKVLMGSPRTVEWMPAVLRAAEALEALVQDPHCAAEFSELKAARGQIQIVAGSTLEASHVLLDMVSDVNAAAQSSKLPPIRLRSLAPSLRFSLL
jgi:hypothetical protein